MLKNLDKPLWPTFSKGEMIEWYRAVAGALLPHLAGRVIGRGQSLRHALHRRQRALARVNGHLLHFEAEAVRGALQAEQLPQAGLGRQRLPEEGGIPAAGAPLMDRQVRAFPPGSVRDPDPAHTPHHRSE